MILILSKWIWRFGVFYSICVSMSVIFYFLFLFYCLIRSYYIWRVWDMHVVYCKNTLSTSIYIYTRDTMSIIILQYFHKWLIIISLNLNLTLRLLFCFNNNNQYNLPLRIYCKNILIILRTYHFLYLYIHTYIYIL